MIHVDFGAGAIDLNRDQHFRNDVLISRVKFHRRNTIVFWSDGQVDFVGSNHVVYSTCNIDFVKLKWDPATSTDVLHERSRHSPVVNDVVVDERDLLLITNQGVYLFSLDRMVVSKTNIETEQAQLFTYANRLQVFSDFLTFDNVVAVCHHNIVSFCDLNAKVCRRKSWRHLCQAMTEVTANNRDPLDNLECRRDPFRVCDLNIRMIKLRQEGSIPPRIHVLFNNNVMRQLIRDSEMRWQFEESSTRLFQGVINDVICSKKANSLVLLLQKETKESVESSLSVFYFDDSLEEKSRWQVLTGLQDYQRVFSVTLQGRY